MTDLSDKMIAKADVDKLPSDHDLRTSALAFNEATEGFYGNPQTVDIKKFMGSWARARRTWCDYTGESLM
ncbi:MAG: hypothetical protein ACXW0Q_00305 [Methylovulum sp.]